MCFQQFKAKKHKLTTTCNTCSLWREEEEEDEEEEDEEEEEEEGEEEEEESAIICAKVCINVFPRRKKELNMAITPNTIPKLNLATRTKTNM